MQPRIDYTNKDYASLREALLKLAREQLPEWTDHSENDAGVMLVEMFSYMGDLLLHYQDRIANESYLDTARERSSVMHLLRLIGYELRPPTAASADLTLLFDAAATGTVTIPTGATFQAKVGSSPVVFRYMRDPLLVNLDALPICENCDPAVPGAVTACDGFEVDNTQYRRLETLPVVQVTEVVSGEIIGSSDGGASQRFTLLRKPIITDSLQITVDEGAGPRMWQPMDTLIYSQPADTHYRLKHDAAGNALVEFGDGRYGRIPHRGQNNILASYQVGGGAEGNVPARTITKAVTDIDGLEYVYNLNPASGGAGAEAISEAVQRGPQQYRAMDRAVTVRDYEFHARQFGVAKAAARSRGWNTIELFIAPAGGGQPTDTLKDDLRAFFDARRMMTSIVEIQDPNYIPVIVQGELRVEPYYYEQQVEAQVQTAVRQLLAFDQVSFGQTLYISKFYEAIEAIEGVRGINISQFKRCDAPDITLCENTSPTLPANGLLRFEWNEIPVAAYTAGIQLSPLNGTT